ncbi:DUF6177 family protein [Nocardiopsis exhalans]|uniref:DUF6177 family protein n=1 Tax=Nocardiopsis exhalans TaxID=163604 RepID=A0ABY5D005_9ACTN|nr:DUF6177 family protein [Nocardiopsis exhalans]USY17474.1 DUF6177 family protein [Nocardiopsis exhalans]
MYRDLVVLLNEHPTLSGLTEALLAAGPELRVRLAADGAVVELRDDSGRLLAAVRAAQRLAVSAEADRVLDRDVTDDLPAQPWWVEGRLTAAGAADSTARGALSRFAQVLTERYGGVICEPERQLGKLDGFLTQDAEHPGVAAVTEHSLVVVEDRPLVTFSSWLVDIMAAHRGEERGLQLVTPSTSRLTPAMETLLTTPLTRWVVVGSDGGYYDGWSGVPLGWHERYGFVSDALAFRADGPHPDFTAGTAPVDPSHLPGNREGGHQLLVDLKSRHPAEADLLLGEAVELVTETLAGTTPALFGPNEPVCLPWDRGSVTRLCRTRAPGPTLLVFGGHPEAVRPPGTRPFSGTFKVKRIEEGVQESVSLTIGFDPGEEPDLSVLLPLVRELCSRNVLHTMVVRHRSGFSDLSRAPRASGTLAPAGIALGVDNVMSIGVDRALSSPVDTTRIGPRLTPSVWYRLDAADAPDPWNHFRSLLSHLQSSRSTV